MISTATNEDCMLFMPRYPDAFFDLAIVDIPFGKNVAKMAYLQEVKTRTIQKNGTYLNANKHKTVYKLKEWDVKTPGQEYYNELCRVSKHQIIFGIDYVDWQGIKPGRIKWNKGFADTFSFNKYEVAYCSLIDNEIELPLLWTGMIQAKSILQPMVQQGNKKLNEKRIHPTQKPILLYERLLTDYARPGFKILDTHLGGGSHRIAAYKLGIDFWACEIDTDYFNEQEIRFKQTISQPLFDNHLKI